MSAAQPLRKEASGEAITTSDYQTTEIYFTKTAPLRDHPTQRCTVIYRSKRTPTGYSEPLKFAFDNDSSSYGHPNLSPDGNLFVFAADLPHGFGGMDLYVCRKTGNKWTAPENLGAGVNTEDNELFPFYLGEGMLFFSSNGRAGFGGYDIYATFLQPTGASSAINMKLPFNSKGDDMAFRCDKTNKTFYLSSNGHKGKGAFDCFKVHRFNTSSLRESMGR